MKGLPWCCIQGRLWLRWASGLPFCATVRSVRTRALKKLSNAFNAYGFFSGKRRSKCIANLTILRATLAYEGLSDVSSAELVVSVLSVDL